MRILLIDDDPRVAAAVGPFLRSSGIELEVIYEASKGVESATTGEFDAIVLDLMMPELDGFEVLERIRNSGVTTPVLFLTGSDSTETLVRALESGGDDFVAKPIDPRALLARLRAVVRRASGSGGSDSRIIRWSSLEIDTIQHRASWAGEPVHLTRTEMRVLHALAAAQGRIVSRDALWRAGWGESTPEGSESLGVHISNLRKRLVEAGADRLLETVRGQGYRLRR